MSPKLYQTSPKLSKTFGNPICFIQVLLCISIENLLERAIADAWQIRVPASVRVLQVGTKIIIL
jgi:hypothetical protein